MDCPRCRHWVPDRANFCQTCGHQFALKVVKSKAPRFAVIVFLLGIFALVGTYLLIRSGRSPTVNRSEPMALPTPPPPSAAPVITPMPVQVSGTPTQDSFAAAGEAPPSQSVSEIVDTRPIALNRPRPNYSDEARNNKVQGVIRARALVGADGLVKDVRLVSHLPDGLDDEARIAIQQMRFRPATKSGEPVNFWQMLEVEFNLR